MFNKYEQKVTIFPEFIVLDKKTNLHIQKTEQ